MGSSKAAIGVDQEPREPGEQRRRAEEERESFRHARRPEVVGDMAVEVLGKQPEGAASLWDRVLGVVAEDEEAKARVPFDAAIGLVAQGHDVENVQTIRVFHWIPTLAPSLRAAAFQKKLDGPMVGVAFTHDFELQLFAPAKPHL